MKHIFKNTNLLTIVLSCCIIVILIVCSSVFRVLNKTIQNEYYSVKNEILGVSANPHIIVVEIDEKSIESIGSFPFPRSVYASLIKNLNLESVPLIAFDILFLDPSEESSDTIFSQAIKDSKARIILGDALDTSGEIKIPTTILDADSYSHGYLSPNVESSNKTVYSFSPKMKDVKGEIYEHFTLQILRNFYDYMYGTSLSSIIGNYEQGNYIISQDVQIPLASKNSEEILINFVPSDSFTRVSVSDVANPSTFEQLRNEIDFRDAIVLVGPAADGLKDNFFTPNGYEFGVNIHANILNTLLLKSYMMYFDPFIEWILIFFIVILSVSLNLSTSSRILVISNLVIILVFWIIIPVSILLGTNLIFNYPSEIIFSLILSVLVANIVKYLIEDKNKQKLNKALSEYVGSHIAAEILDEDGSVDFDGQEKNLVCFFSDIEGFTSLSEILSPIELVGFLRVYLTHMTESIMDQKGYVDKFEGDAIMALWGAFSKQQDTKDDSVRACATALIHQETIKKINTEWKDKLKRTLRVRIGIHSGNAIIGNIGAIGKKMSFTALGDNINLASRLEGANKYYGTLICVSESVYFDTQDAFEFRFLDEIQVKGKDISVKIYELLANKGELSIEKKSQIYKFSEARELYTQKNFKEAQAIFLELEKLGDAPSKYYAQRCACFQKNPPSKDWTGVWRMTEK
ncbi:adenylate/guanylate cyclase domain-containing protein [Candidatus Gracilibacteria bacterium]|nr:adenylate/guanylate cyclase domain-containing protein [Candidatus Gracilibacteria bacterium]